MLKIALLLCLSGLVAWGQTTTAQITGKVTDASGAALVGARISVTNAGNGAVRAAQANDSGNYILPLLEPAVYNLRVEKEGFTALAQNGLTLHVDQAARMDFQLQVGTV